MKPKYMFNEIEMHGSKQFQVSDSTEFRKLREAAQRWASSHGVFLKCEPENGVVLVTKVPRVCCECGATKWVGSRGTGTDPICKSCHQRSEREKRYAEEEGNWSLYERFNTLWRVA